MAVKYGTKDTVYRNKIVTPIGRLTLLATDKCLNRILFEGETDSRLVGKNIINKENKILKKTAKDLEDYFSGGQPDFLQTFDLEGTDFQKKVWKQIAKIPYGKTITYKQLAEKVGKPKAARAIGSACGKNPLPLIISCHRVVASNGDLGGYGGGLKIKKYLLKLERK